MDETQYEEGSGPCLDAAADPSRMRSVPVAAEETRWPGFAEAAIRAGVGSSLSVGIPVVQQLSER